MNEWTKHINEVLNMTNLNYPKGGSQGVYLVDLFKCMIQIDGRTKDLFLVMCLATNEYNQVSRTREELSKAIGIEKFNKGNMSKMLKKLVDLEMIAVFGNKVVINPFLVLPLGRNNVKLKDALQISWEELILYDKVNY